MEINEDKLKNLIGSPNFVLEEINIRYSYSCNKNFIDETTQNKKYKDDIPFSLVLGFLNWDINSFRPDPRASQLGEDLVIKKEVKGFLLYEIYTYFDTKEMPRFDNINRNEKEEYDETVVLFPRFIIYKHNNKNYVYMNTR